MIRRRSQGCLRYAADSLYMFSHFRTGQEATVTGFCTLADFNEDTCRVRDHMLALDLPGFLQEPDSADRDFIPLFNKDESFV